MKIYLILILFSTGHLLALTQYDCQELNALQLPNCSDEKYLLSAEIGLNGEPGDLSELCECKKTLEKKIAIFPGLKIEKPNLNLKKVLLDELKKTIVANLLDVTNLRSTYDTSGDFSEASSACNLEKLNSVSCLQSEDLNILKKEIVSELANLLNPKSSTINEGIFDRSSKAQSCNAEISDREILLINSNTLEETIIFDKSNPSFIDRISNLNPVTVENVKAHLNKLGNTVLSDFSHHPLFASLLSRPENLKKIFQTLEKPITATNFRNTIYKNKTNGQNVADDIAKRCNSSFRAFSENICSEPIQSNKINLKSFSLPNPYTHLQSGLLIGESVSTDNVDQAIRRLNYLTDMVKICDNITKNKDGKDLNSIINSISGWLPGSQSQVPLKSFSENRYSSQIGKQRALLCDILNKNPEKTCKSTLTTQECSLLQNYRKTRDETQPEYKLARHPSASMNNLLRSMIGNPNAKDLTPDTAKILISEGIIPATENGQVIIAEQIDRSPGPSFGQARSSQNNTSTASASVSRKTSATAQSARMPLRSSQPLPSIPENNVPAENFNTPSSIADGIDQSRLRNIADDIIRQEPSKSNAPSRLVRNAPASAQAQADQAGKTAATITPAPQPQTSPASSAPSFSGSDGSKVSLSNDGVSAEEKLARSQMNAARADMYGAKGGASSAGSGSNDASTLTTAKGEAGRQPASITEDTGIEVASIQALQKQLANSDILSNPRNFSFKLNGKDVVVIYNRQTEQFEVSADSKIPKDDKVAIESFFNREKKLARSTRRTDLVQAMKGSN